MKNAQMGDWPYLSIRCLEDSDYLIVYWSATIQPNKSQRESLLLLCIQVFNRSSR